MYNEALQAIEFKRQIKFEEVFLLGSSGGAIVAINVVLELPDIITKVIAESFEGEKAVEECTALLKEDRELSKKMKKHGIFMK